MTRTATGLLAAAAAMLLCFPASEASAQQRHTQVGTLSCQLKPSVGLIIGSRQRMDCRFTPTRGSRERYSGAITRIGLDLGFTTGGRLVWGVFAPSAGPRRGALAGTYVGASGDIAFGLGLGANVLVGGFNRSIALQPLSVSGQTGISLAAGVAGLTLR